MSYRVSAPPKSEPITGSLYPQTPVTPVTVVTNGGTDDPILTPEQWWPEFHRFHVGVVRETLSLDWGWLRGHRPELFQSILDTEAELDRLGDTRLSEVMQVMGKWRRLILRAESERQGTDKQKNWKG